MPLCAELIELELESFDICVLAPWVCCSSWCPRDRFAVGAVLQSCLLLYCAAYGSSL
jgi:hypothetical protein